MGSEAKLIEALEQFINVHIEYVREVTDDRHTDDEGNNDIHNGTVECYGNGEGFEDSLDYLRNEVDSETVFEADCIDSGVLDGLEYVLRFLKQYKAN
jgi:hypothetical protein